MNSIKAPKYWAALLHVILSMQNLKIIAPMHLSYFQENSIIIYPY